MNWFRICNFEINAGDVEQGRNEEVDGKDQVFNAFNLDRGMSTAKLTRIVKRQEFIVAEVLIRGRPYVGFNTEPFQDTDEELKKKAALKKLCDRREMTKVTEFAGIRNEGATCYLNSLLQSYFMIGAFTRSVFEMEVSEGRNVMKSIPNALQRLFYTLQQKKEATTRLLLKSFGWGV